MEYVRLSELVNNLFQDSKFFLQECKTHSENKPFKGTFARAAILTVWSGFEGWVNKTCQEFSKKTKDLSINEIGFLRERRIKLKKGEFVLTKADKYENIENKIEFLLKRFANKKLDKGGKDWIDFKRAKSLRDSIVHPKLGADRSKTFTMADAELTHNILSSFLKLLAKEIYGTKLTF